MRSFSAVASSYDPVTRPGSLLKRTQSWVKRMTFDPRPASISSSVTDPATSASRSSAALMHSASMPTSQSASVTATARSCAGR